MVILVNILIFWQASSTGHRDMTVLCPPDSVRVIANLSLYYYEHISSFPAFLETSKKKGGIGLALHELFLF